ncbi:ABC transporter ATP-binding protein [Rhodohalobacter halophilus]|uniref:ABC transporter ATP-binding protein n=1 Tax=Rhodohalobacter halophilus TaxID=1812810 RepID=UPI00083F7D29|nr:ABC transporter ATP-binding protein [Rhodohalobacter halophilus]
MIRAKQLTKVYRTEEIETTALNRLDLVVDEGEFVAIMGPSGCGKSTLLNIMGLLDSPTDGEYIFLNQETSDFSERDRAKLRMGNIGFIFQNFNLIDELTVFENVELPLEYLGMKPKKSKEKVEQALEHMGMTARRNHFPNQLSGGQQQRAAIARAVVTEPKLILADEPTGNLDSGHGTEVMELLSALNSRGTTIVMVTHSPVDAEFADRIIHLKDGMIAEGEPVYQTGT